jgi:hypothetical protein
MVCKPTTVCDPRIDDQEIATLIQAAVRRWRASPGTSAAELFAIATGKQGDYVGETRGERITWT